MQTLKFALWRLASAIPTLFGLVVIAFILANYLPGDPLTRLIGERNANNPAIRAAYEAKWSLDEPAPQRFLSYLQNLFHGDLGISTMSRRPVLTDLSQYLPATIELAIAAILVSGTFGLVFGVIAAYCHNRWPDYSVRALALLASGVPVFWLGLIGLQLFYVRLNVFPGPEGRISGDLNPPRHITGLYTVDSLLTGNLAAFSDTLWHLVLPALVLGSFFLGLLARITRASMLEVLQAPYLVTARAKGLRRRTTVIVHVMPNVLIPVVTVLGLAVGGLLAGAVLTETVFAWPGVGRYAVDAAKAVDYQAILGVTLLIGFIYVITNAVVDVVYGLLDPRIRQGR